MLLSVSFGSVCLLFLGSFVAAAAVSKLEMAMTMMGRLTGNLLEASFAYVQLMAD